MLLKNVFAIWDETHPTTSVLLSFYSRICLLRKVMENLIFMMIFEEKLVALGIPKEEIAFIHEANSDKQRMNYLQKLEVAEVRILMGSTQKMGAGTNVQKALPFMI